MTDQNIITVEQFTWMKSIIAKNDGHKYYMIGQVKDHADTLLVTLAGGNGGAVMFCQKHSFAYPIMGTCDECRNAPRDVATDASATTCGSPEIQRN
jgi:hypothetical protein